MTRKKAPDRHGIDADPTTADEDGIDTRAFLAELGRQLGVDTSEGWEGLSDAGGAMMKQRLESMRAMKAEANIFRDTFMTPAGRKCLAIMKEMTVDAEPYPSEAMLSIEQITPLVIAHTAICKFYRGIEQAIAHADNREAKRKV